MIIKICGMTRPQDVKFCDQAGADLLGFIFHPPSPRHVTPRWAASQKPHQALKVGVFVHQNLDEIQSLAQQAQVDLLQLHGGHSVEQCRALGPHRVIKTLWPMNYAQVHDLQADMERFAPVCRAFLFDSGTRGGGHGQSLDLDFLRGLTSTHPWYLAGGLGPDNLELVTSCGARGFDLNSGLEKAPGVKDHHKVQQALILLRGQS
ncbi:MAG: phosphoribosylanthranilate isomerase [Desulfomicrobium sp.]|nr:phosphoribosylanthranilate isomerase [Desulfomicrobium sp.]